MLAAVIRGSQLRLVEKPLPRLRPGWAVVRVRLAGICNTDVELLRGYHDFHGTPGHEFVGEVVRVEESASSSRVDRVHRKAPAWLGRRVVGEINIACASLGSAAPCAYCRRGLCTHCLRRRVLGIVGQDGAFAEFVCLPLGNLHAVPEGVTDEQAVFTEPLAAACEILEQVRVEEHREAAVLGDGKLAQLAARVLQTAGPRVVMFGKHMNKLSVARRAGISTTLLGRPGSSRAQAKRGQYSLVVEATGSASGLALAQQLAAPRGTIVLKSTFHGAARVETWPIVVHELTLVGSRCGPFSPALALLREGRVNLRPLISRVFPLRRAPEAVRCAQQPGVLKVLLRP